MTSGRIEVRQLTRDFQVPLHKDQAWWQSLLGRHRRLCAVDNVSFSITGGERVALIGRNGSGKSTLIKLLTGVILPTSGTAAVLGSVPWRRDARFLRRIGVMFGQKSLLFPDLTVRDALRLYGVLYGMVNEEFQGSLKEMDDYLSFSRLLDRPTRKLSLGERMRCEVVAALLHRPDVIFLDEPTIGLDADTRNGLVHYLTQRIGPEQTLVITTHELGLIRSLCSRILIMHQGRLINDLPTTAIPDVVHRIRVTVRYRQVDDENRLERVIHQGRVVDNSPGLLVLDCPTEAEEHVKQELSQAVKIVELATSETPLDAVLEELTAGSPSVAAVPTGGGHL